MINFIYIHSVLIFLIYGFKQFGFRGLSLEKYFLSQNAKISCLI